MLAEEDCLHGDDCNLIIMVTTKADTQSDACYCSLPSGAVPDHELN
jgi:hypothetical protein